MAEHLRASAKVRIATDASSWGLGGVLYIDDVLTAALHPPITPHNEATFVFKVGDESGQQCWWPFAIGPRVGNTPGSSSGSGPTACQR